MIPSHGVSYDVAPGVRISTYAGAGQRIVPHNARVAGESCPILWPGRSFPGHFSWNQATITREPPSTMFVAPTPAAIARAILAPPMLDGSMGLA